MFKFNKRYFVATTPIEILREITNWYNSRDDLVDFRIWSTSKKDQEILECDCFPGTIEVRRGRVRFVPDGISKEHMRARRGYADGCFQRLNRSKLYILVKNPALKHA